MTRKLITLMLLLALAAGCTLQPPEAPSKITLATLTPTATLPVLEATVVESTITPVPTALVENDSDECDNPFYPVSDEATWTYSLSTGGSAVHVMAVDENGAFTIHIQAEESSFTIDGDCTDEGIVVMNAPGAQTTANSSDGSTVVSTIDVQGVTLPKDIKINDQWSQTLNVTTGDQKTFVYTEYTALGFENITVPAGNFYVLKVEQSGYIEIYGQKVDLHGYQWFAEGVGTVKSEIDGAEAVELVSYDIPD